MTAHLTAGDIVVTEAGTVVLVTFVGRVVVETNGTTLYNDGIVLSSAAEGFARTGFQYAADQNTNVRLVCNIRDALRILEERGLNFERAEKELTEIEKLRKDLDALQAENYQLKNSTGVKAVTFTESGVKNEPPTV